MTFSWFKCKTAVWSVSDTQLLFSFDNKHLKMATNLENAESAGKKRNYKWCFVPLCTNNNICSPSKIFLSVPKGEIRRKWFEISGRTDAATVSLSSSLFCCENHFNVSSKNTKSTITIQIILYLIIHEPSLSLHRQESILRRLYYWLCAQGTLFRGLDINFLRVLIPRIPQQCHRNLDFQLCQKKISVIIYTKLSIWEVMSIY